MGVAVRHEFTRKTKAKAYVRCGGFCEGVKEDGSRCGLKLQVGRITYDHRIPDWLGGDNSLENCQVLGWCCDKPKTKEDQGRIAKTKRIIDRHTGAKTSSRPMAGSRRSGWKHKIGGGWVKRENGRHGNPLD